MLHRLGIFIIDLFFPPLGVILLTGLGYDTALNCLLFLCGVIPSHVHAFYVSCTYFSRRRKVKKNRWPGPPRPFIFSDNVQNGGMTSAAVKRLEWENSSRREKLKSRPSYRRV